MEKKCSRCGAVNLEIARFCRTCGLSLTPGIAGSHGAGRVAHPHPLDVSPDYDRCEGAADLFYRVESSLGGQALLDTEGASIFVYNRGYGLREVELEIIGLGDLGGGRGKGPLLKLDRAIDSLPQGRELRLEVPSYEIATPIQELIVTLAAAEFEWVTP